MLPDPSSLAKGWGPDYHKMSSEEHRITSEQIGYFHCTIDISMFLGDLSCNTLAWKDQCSYSINTTLITIHKMTCSQLNMNGKTIN